MAVAVAAAAAAFILNECRATPGARSRWWSLGNCVFFVEPGHGGRRQRRRQLIHTRRRPCLLVFIFYFAGIKGREECFVKVALFD